MGGKKPASSVFVSESQIPFNSGNKLVSEPMGVEGRIDKIEQQISTLGAEMIPNIKSDSAKINGMEFALMMIQEQVTVLIGDMASTSAGGF